MVRVRPLPPTSPRASFGSSWSSPWSQNQREVAATVAAMHADVCARLVNASLLDGPSDSLPSGQLKLAWAPAAVALANDV